MKFWLYIIVLLCGCSLSMDSHSAPLLTSQLQDSTLSEKFDIAPQFRGGATGWQRFLQQNLDIREAVRAMDSTAYVDYGFRQTALLEFTVCEDGKVCDIVITNKHNISPEFGKEALRVMKKSPKWTPASKEGRPVRTRVKQSITAILH